MKFINNLLLMLAMLCMNACATNASTDTDSTGDSILLTTHIAPDMIQDSGEINGLSRAGWNGNLPSHAGITLTSELELQLTALQSADISIDARRPASQHLTIHLDSLELQKVDQGAATPLLLTARVYLSKPHPASDTQQFRKVSVTSRAHRTSEWAERSNSLMKYELRRMSGELANTALEILSNN